MPIPNPQALQDLYDQATDRHTQILIRRFGEEVAPIIDSYLRGEKPDRQTKIGGWGIEVTGVQGVVTLRFELMKHPFLCNLDPVFQCYYAGYTLRVDAWTSDGSDVLHNHHYNSLSDAFIYRHETVIMTISE